MATVGQQLLQPEAGWRRYNDDDRNIEYSKGFIVAVNAGYYSGDIHYLPTGVSALEEYIKFNFTGRKLRIIANTDSGYTSHLVVKIDDELYSANPKSAGRFQVLIFSVEDLTNREHSVEIYSMDSSRYSFDAVDVDGILLPYRRTDRRYLIKTTDEVNTLLTDKDGAKLYILSHTEPTLEDYIEFGAQYLEGYEGDVSRVAYQMFEEGELGSGKVVRRKINKNDFKINEIEVSAIE